MLESTELNRGLNMNIKIQEDVMWSLNRQFLVGAFVLLSASSVAAQDATLEKAQKAGAVKAGVVQGMPYSDVTPDGKPTGLFPLVALKVLQNLGIKNLEPTMVDYKGSIPGLHARRWDMVTAALTITAERCEVVLFSQPLMISSEVLVVPKGKDIKDYQAFKDRSLKLAVIVGGSQEAYARGAGGLVADQIVPVADYRTGLSAIEGGRAQAMAAGHFSAVALLDNDKDRDKYDIAILNDLPKSGGGIAFRKTDREFRDRFDGELDKLRASGELLTMAKEWKIPAIQDDLMKVKRANLAGNCE